MRSELRPEVDPDRLELPRDVFPRDELELPLDVFELPRGELVLLDAMVMVLSGKKCLGCAREPFALRRLRRTLADLRSRGKRPVADRFRTTQNKMHSTTSCTTGPAVQTGPKNDREPRRSTQSAGPIRLGDPDSRSWDGALQLARRTEREAVHLAWKDGSSRTTDGRTPLRDRNLASVTDCGASLRRAGHAR